MLRFKKKSVANYLFCISFENTKRFENMKKGSHYILLGKD